MTKLMLGVTHTFVWLDLGYTAELVRENDGGVYFIVFRIVRKNGNKPVYHRHDEDCNSITEDTDKAVPFFEGEMNRDGCVNGEMTVHFCFSEHIENFNRMTIRLYETAYGIVSGKSSGWLLD